MKVSWDDELPNIWENKSHVPNHQPNKHTTRDSGSKKYHSKLQVLEEESTQKIQKNRPNFWFIQQKETCHLWFKTTTTTTTT